jgi:hypothetical protein
MTGAHPAAVQPFPASGPPTHPNRTQEEKK